jgi:hypothetical protein
MTIDFKYDEIKEKELRYGKPIAGYFSPDGHILPFNDELGESTHYASDNPVAITYLKYISYVVTGDTKNSKYAEYLREHKPDKLKDMSNDNFDELVYRGYTAYYTGLSPDFDEFYFGLMQDFEACEGRIKKGERFRFDRFKLNLMKMFINAYRDHDYITSVGKMTRIDNKFELREKIKKEENLSEEDSYVINSELKKRVAKEMLSGFKDICIQMLGYDALERYGPNNKKIEIPEDPDKYDEMFRNTPRIITSSHNDIYERFYNYILMDWEVYKVPKYTYNERTGIFEKEETIFNMHKEEKEAELKEEIQSVKKLVPPNERPQFFKR